MSLGNVDLWRASELFIDTILPLNNQGCFNCECWNNNVEKKDLFQKTAEIVQHKNGLTAHEMCTSLKAMHIRLKTTWKNRDVGLEQREKKSQLRNISEFSKLKP